MNDTTTRPVRPGTIVEGCILLLVAAIALAATFFGGWSPTIIVWGVVAFGAVLVLAGVVGAVARAVRRPTASTDRLIDDSAGAPLP